ncbi:MAG: PEP-CTERM sorting domain-containing protein [Deltaproteobacteria bacterium]|nr:PEP-CTERM sorting domain-containing protein [Deltaproteobacteria bacterium]
MSRWIVLAVCGIALQLGAGQAAAVGFGALGDSLTDEYLVDDPNITHTDLPAFNWVQLLAELRGVDFGEFSAEKRKEPRNAGYAYNWGRAGGTARSGPIFIAAGGLDVQTFGSDNTPGLLPDITNGNVEIVFIGAGHNDYFYRDYLANGFEQIMGNDAELFILDDSDFLIFEQQVLDGILNSVDAILAANENAKIVVASLPPDTLLSISYIVDAMRQLDGRLETELATRDQARVKLIDLYAWESERYDGGDQFQFGGYEMARDSKASEEQLTPEGTDSAGSEPCDSIGRCATLDYALNLVCHDEPGGHPGTLMQGLIANEVIAAVNPWLDSEIAPFTDEELLVAAVPEPGSTLLMGTALGVLAALRAAKTRRRGRSAA